MGRPIKSKYFGIRKGVGTGGEGVTAVTIGGTAPVSTLTVTVVLGAPNIAGGTQATATAVKTGNTVTSVTITNQGSGYTSAPTVVFTGTNMTTQGTGHTATISVNTVSNVILVEAYVPAANGGSSGVTGDILEQVASKKYRVQTAQGTGTCLLTTATGALTAGKVRIVAEDTNGSTYFIKKLTARRAVLSRSTVSTAFIFDNSGSVGWNLSAASATSVKIRSH
ncbi:MAG: hypothetical protein EBU90_10005 [Proteobacteria bacterium]|nr:hypothetical protein [Pseudomonadota bacterium]NBP14921.1 hypothetical protein [bacterium]